MTIKIIKTGETARVSDSYGMRLIEQGKAVAVRAAKKAPKKETAKASDA